MKILMNRERKGKKQIEAPKEIEVYDDIGKKISTIMFYDVEFPTSAIVIKNHDGKRLETIIRMSDDGFIPQNNECKFLNEEVGIYASVGEPWRFRGYSREKPGSL